MKFATILLLMTGAASLQVAAAELELAGLTAVPGQRISGYIEIAAAKDSGTRIPVTIIQGRKPGPTLALIAGTHGVEYAPIIALQRLRGELDPNQLSGALIIVHIANPPAFYGRSIYINPVDGHNLNRVYPGKVDGSLSERIAYTITHEVIENSDYLIDLHAGDGNEALRPYVYMPVTGNPVLDEASRGLAVAFGLDHIVIDRARLPQGGDTKFTDYTALVRGIPAITTETGQSASTDEQWVALATQGVGNVMRHLGMLPGHPDVNDGIVWLSDYEVVPSPQRGLFKASVRDGYAIAEGGTLGTLYDEFGQRIEDIRSPFAGIVNYVISTPPVSKGEPVAMVSRIVAAETGGDPQ